MKDSLENAKYEFLLDVIRRASANGTQEEVARALAADYNPSYLVLPNGTISIKLIKEAS